MIKYFKIKDNNKQYVGTKKFRDDEINIEN